MSVTRASGGTASRPSGNVGIAASPGVGACAPGSRGAGTGVGVVPVAGACPGSAGGKSPFGSSGAGACAMTPAASKPAAAISIAAHERASASPRIRVAYFFVPKSTVGGLLIAASFSTENCGRCL